jgi:CRISPR-associated protein Csd2
VWTCTCSTVTFCCPFPRRLVVFEHESDLGNAPAHKLFERVKVSRAPGSDGPPRAYSDYLVTLDAAALPAGVKVLDLI